MKKPLIGALLALLFALQSLPVFAAADDIARLYNFSAGTTIRSAYINAEFNQLISTMNNKAGRAVDNTLSGNNTYSGTSLFSGATTFTSTATFSDTTGVTTNTITERSAGNGVLVDSVTLKDGAIVLSPTIGYTPASNGALGYDSTTHSYAVMVNGVATSLVTASAVPAPTFVFLSNVQTSGTGGGTSGSSATWNKMPLNTKTESSAVPIATLSSSVISLPAGTYRVTGSSPIFTGNTGTNAHLRLRDTTNSVTLVMGSPQSHGTNIDSTVLMPIQGRFTLSGTANIELQYYLSAGGGYATSGLGQPSGSGENEVYAVLEIIKE